MPRVVHFEYTVDDPERAIVFYQNVFGWKIQEWDGPVDYSLITTGEEGGSGIDGALMFRAEGMPNVINTVDVADLDALIAVVESNGGKITAPRMSIPGVGFFVYALDSEAAAKNT